MPRARLRVGTAGEAVRLVHSPVYLSVRHTKDRVGTLKGHLCALSRHRGLIHAYEFAVDQLAFQSALPVCRSACDATAGYNYDLALAFS